MVAVKEKTGIPFTRPAAPVVNVTALGLGAKTRYSSSDMVCMYNVGLYNEIVILHISRLVKITLQCVRGSTIVRCLAPRKRIVQMTPL